MANTLCSRCDGLDFDELFNGQLEEGIYLDTWKAICARRRSCKFCYLIEESLETRLDHPRPADNDRISVYHAPAWKRCVAVSNLDDALSSNKQDLRDHVKKHGLQNRSVITVTHRGQVPCERQGEIQLLAEGLEDHDSSSLLGRRVWPDQVHADLLLSWFCRCNEYHGADCQEGGVLSDDLPKGFRVIDMQEQVIVPWPGGQSAYVALSYVWGQHLFPPVESRRHNVRTDPMGKEVIDLPGDIPATISDAMNVAVHLGFRYFWVDALCIIQDDPNDKSAQISHMDAVYNSAALTIVAGTSPHAGFGLHGMSQSRSMKQVSHTIKERPMAIVLPRYPDVDTSRVVWNTRGWTLQEKIFSRRILFFTDHQVYFKCKNVIWCEDVRMETKDFSKSFLRQVNPLAWAPERHSLHEAAESKYSQQYWKQRANAVAHWEYGSLGLLTSYTAVVEAYTRRAMTNKEDTLVAVTGVLETLDLGPLYAGIPSHKLLLLLLWHPRVGSRCSPKGLQLPSWAWAAYDFEHGCVWSMLTRSVGSYASESGKVFGTKAETAYRVTVSALSQRSYDRVGERATEKLWKRPTIPPAAREALHANGTVLRLEDVEIREFGINSTSPSSSPAEQATHHTLHDPQGLIVGEVVMSPASLNTLTESGKKISFLRLAEGRGMDSAEIDEKYYSKHWDAINMGAASIPYYRTLREKAEWKVLHVLMVEWVGEKVARRVGVGRVVKKAWGSGVKGEVYLV